MFEVVTGITLSQQQRSLFLLNTAKRDSLVVMVKTLTFFLSLDPAIQKCVERVSYRTTAEFKRFSCLKMQSIFIHPTRKFKIVPELLIVAG